jgi:hypothetical protein
MSRIAVVLSVFAAIVVADADAARACKPDRLSVRFTVPVPVAETLELVDSATGDKVTLGLSASLPNTWTFSPGRVLHDLSMYRNLRPRDECIQVSAVLGPDSLTLDDGACHGLMRMTATVTCWSLKVMSTPYGYPFEFEGKGVARERRDNGGEGWNVVKRLKKQIPELSIDVFAKKANVLLVRIPTTYAELSDAGGAAELDFEGLLERIVLPKPVYNNFNEPQEGVDDAIKRLLLTTHKLRGVKLAAE